MKPTINKIGVFDATKNYIVEFAYQGNQPYRNDIYIYNATTAQLIFSESVESMKCEHIIPANKLKNNVQYYVQVCTYDVNGQCSDISDALYFYCYSTPQLSLNNLNSDGSTIINASNYDVQVAYSQKEGRSLREYIYYLYDANKTQIYVSGTKYYSSDMSNLISCPIKSLENRVSYYFSIRIITVDGVVVELPLTKLSTKYDKPHSYSVLNVECNKAGGFMKYNTYIVMVSGKATGRYEINNGILNVIDGKVYYDTGFNITDDFIIGIKYKNGIIRFKNELDEILLTQEEYEGKIHYKLKITNSDLPSCIIYSKFYEKNIMRTVYIKRIHGVYGLYIKESEG